MTSVGGVACLPDLGLGMERGGGIPPIPDGGAYIPGGVGGGGGGANPEGWFTSGTYWINISGEGSIWDEAEEGRERLLCGRRGLELSGGGGANAGCCGWGG
mmetsp:Transcript_5766/g.7792  ORF Transcript_5766/g.7792 Transcript_5766/m.7792 type:complete len:101 (+) Transcript_5766:121-423(+)